MWHTVKSADYLETQRLSNDGIVSTNIYPKHMGSTTKLLSKEWVEADWLFTIGLAQTQARLQPSTGMLLCAILKVGPEGKDLEKEA